MLILFTLYYILTCIYLTVSIVFYHFCVGSGQSTTNKRILLLLLYIHTYLSQGQISNSTNR